jgi:membrane-bound lytic murein transglycosylase D
MRGKLSGASGPASWLIVAAAYNAGLSELQSRVGVYKTSSYWDMKLPLETENYVPRWIALWLIDSYRTFYGVEVPPTPSLQFETLENIRLARDVPLGLVAAVSESSVRFIRELNGSVQKGETAFRASAQGNGTLHTIHLPVGCKESVLKALRERGYVQTETSGATEATPSRKGNVYP